MENKMKFIKDQNAFIVIAGALFLPFVFGLCAIAFDLGLGLNHQARLSDLLIESSLMSSSTLEDEDSIKEKVKILGKSYLPNQKLQNIQIIDPETPQSPKEEIQTSVYATLEYRGIFGKFIDEKQEHHNIISYAKYEGLEGELAYSDYVFSIAFTGSATQDSSLLSHTAQKLCSSNENLISKGFCNPPLGEAKAIDAVQSIIAYTISLAKSFDKDNSQYFGFVPYGGGSQVKGKDLGEEVNIDVNDGLSKEERNKMTYVIWPIQIFSPPSFKNYDIYSRFYPKEVLDQSNSLLREKVIKRLEELKVDTSLFTHIDLSQYILQKFELKEDNPLLKQHSLSDFNEAKEALNLIFENQAVGEENGLVNSSENVAQTIENIFNPRASVTYRLYNKEIDTIVLNTSKDELIEAAKHIQSAQASLNSILADINILRKLKEKISSGEISSGGGGGGLPSFKNTNEIKDYLWDLLDNDPDSFEKIEQYCFDGEYNDCDNRIDQLEGEGKTVGEIVKELHLDELAGGGGTPNIGDILDKNQEIFLPPDFKKLKSKIQSLKSEIRNLKDDGIYKLCSDINSFTESYVIELCNTSFKPTFDDIVDKIQQKQKELQEVEPKYLEALAHKEALDRLISQSLNESSPDALLAKRETEKSMLEQQVKSYENTLENGVTIKGKALCNSFATFINGAACQTKSAGGLKFHEIPLKTIKNNEEIKDIGLLNEDPFEIDIRFKTYITGVGQEHDYASIGLIRSALMLSKSQTQNPNAKIIVFSTTANQNDEALFKAGLCQAIKEGIKTRTGANVEIYAVALGLPTDEQREVNQEKYKKIWSSCTSEENILLGDNIDSLLEKISKGIFKGGGGKITFDSVK